MPLRRDVLVGRGSRGRGSNRGGRSDCSAGRDRRKGLGLQRHGCDLHAGRRADDVRGAVGERGPERGRVESGSEVVRRERRQPAHEGRHAPTRAERHRRVGAGQIHHGGVVHVAGRRHVTGERCAQLARLCVRQRRGVQICELHGHFCTLVLQAILGPPARHALALPQGARRPGPLARRAQIASRHREVPAPCARRAGGAGRHSGQHAVVSGRAADADAHVRLAQRRLEGADRAGIARARRAGASLFAVRAPLAFGAAGLRRSARLVAPSPRRTRDASAGRTRAVHVAPCARRTRLADLSACGAFLRRPRAGLASCALARGAQAVRAAPPPCGARLARLLRRRAKLRAPFALRALGARAH
mmetsp:Transcript_67136/g.205578  ORF Transcript_67136/g.205578 Transcript_67136/m.205578 type:complete len:360 (+) Transcript_67136:234-1313(+)